MEQGIEKPLQNLVKVFDAAEDLVKAVEKYVRQECLRTELLNKKDILKKLLNE